jgi:hypothetical protein
VKLRDTNRVRGSIFSIEKLGALQADNCNALLVSDRTLYLMQQFAREEVNIISRYAKEFLDDGYYFALDLSDTVEVDLAQEVARNYRLEVVDMSCDIVEALNAINATLGTSACGCEGEIGIEADNEEGEEGGSVPSDIGPYSYAAETDGISRKCKVANWIYFSVHDVVEQFVLNDVEGLADLGIAVSLSLVAGIIGTIALGPFGGLIGVVAGLVVTLTASLLKVGVNMTATLTQLEGAEDELICALLDATDVDGARTAFAAELDTASMTALNKAVIMIMLSNSVLNVLFFDQEEADDFFDTYTAPNPCQGCSQSGPFSHWELEEASGTRVDSIGSNDLADNNTVTRAAGSASTWAAEFVAANEESLTIASNATLQMGTAQAFTINCWVYLDSKPATGGIISKWDNPDHQEYLLEYKGGGTDRFRFLISTNGLDSGHVIVPANVLGSPSIDTWYLLTAWFDPVNDNINIQVNDGAWTSTATTLGAFSDDTEFAIGTMQLEGARNNWFDGRVDEVRMWKRVLSEAERDAFYP